MSQWVKRFEEVEIMFQMIFQKGLVQILRKNTSRNHGCIEIQIQMLLQNSFDPIVLCVFPYTLLGNCNSSFKLICSPEKTLMHTESATQVIV